MDLEMNMNGTCDLSMPMGGMMMPGMKMFFHFDSCERLLFYTWQITNPGQLVGAIIAVVLLAIAYEGLKTLRDLLLYWDMKRSKGPAHVSTNTYESLEEKNNSNSSSISKITKKGFTISLSVHALQSALHVVQVGHGYILMLVAMTFNVWLFLAVCFGAGIGYFIFARTRHIFGMNDRERNEHCH